jgi:hypothetical protein
MCCTAATGKREPSSLQFPAAAERERSIFFFLIMSTNGLGTPINSPSYFTSSTLHARGCGHGEYAAFLLVLPSLPCFTILARLPTPYPFLHLSMAAVKLPAPQIHAVATVVWHSAPSGGSSSPTTSAGSIRCQSTPGFACCGSPAPSSAW